MWATWVQKTYLAISVEPWLKFSQTAPHFLQNHKMNPTKLSYLKKVLGFGVWGLETTFEPLGPRRRV